jgi:hypothetical protein
LVELDADPKLSRARHDSGTSLTTDFEGSKPSRSNSGVMDVNVDVEKGESVKAQTELKLSMSTEQAVLQEYVRSSKVIGNGW